MLKKTTLILAIFCSLPALAMLPNPNTTTAQASVPVVSFGNIANTDIAPQSTMQLNKVIYQSPEQVNNQTTILPSSNQAVTTQPPAMTNNGAVQTAVEAYLVGAGDTLIPITQGVAVQSGDVVEYRAYYTNTSGDRIRSMKAQLDIPEGVELVGGLSPVRAFASLDGSRFVRTPVRGNIGGQIQEVPLALYKALRWDIEDIGIGGTAIVKYRARIK